METPSSVRKIVLLVDDEPEITAFQKDLLLDVGVDSIVAHNGIEALAACQDYDFDAIVSDLNMPKMNGFNLLRILRTRGLLRPFIVISASSEKEKIMHSLQLGALAFLTKPFRSEEFVEFVTRAAESGYQMKGTSWGTALMEQVLTRTSTEAQPYHGRTLDFRLGELERAVRAAQIQKNAA